MFIKSLSILLLLNLSFYLCADKEDAKLKGKIISSDEESELLENAFDNDYDVEFKSEKASNGWIGLELEKEYVITKIGWAQKGEKKNDYLLGIFEGANNETFIDAIPLHMITKEGKQGEMNYVQIGVTRKFKYIRYVGPNNKYSVISGFEVYGHTSSKEEEEEKLYQPTNLPLLVINTEGSVDPYDKDNKQICNVITINNGKLDANNSGTIKLRGNSTYKLEKKSYRLKFDSKTRIYELPAKAKNWNILANHMDKTLARNPIAFHISGLLGMRYVPGCKMVDLMINGEYKGTYMICDRMEVGKKRIKVEKMDETCIEEPEISGGYLIEADGTAGRKNRNGEMGYRSGKGISYRVRYPKTDKITQEQLKYIQGKFDEMENEVYNGVVDKIDVESFIQFLLTEEICGDEDSLWANVYITKDRDDDKFRFGPVWDFDLSQDNDIRLYPTNNRDNFVYKYGPSAGSIKTFVNHILANKAVLPLFKAKWEEVTAELVNEKTILAFIDEFVELVNESQKLNFMRWSTALKTKITYNAQALGSYEAEVENLKKYFSERFEVLDNIIQNANATTIEQTGGNAWGGGFGGNWGGNRGNRTQGGAGGFDFGGFGGDFGGFGGFNWTEFEKNRNGSEFGGFGGFGGDFGAFNWSDFGGDWDPSNFNASNWGGDFNWEGFNFAG